MAPECAAAATAPRWLQAAQPVAQRHTWALLELALPSARVQPLAAEAGAAHAVLGLRQ